MPGNRYPLIARETWPILLVFCVLLLIARFQFGQLAFVLVLLVFLIILYLFRDPYRQIPSDPLGVVSPVHGVVTLIEEAEDVRLQRTAKRIQIKMRFYDIYSIRSPIEGKVCEQWSSAPDARESKRHFDFWIKTDEGDDVVTAVRLQHFVRRCHIYMHSGERVGHGQRCGYIYFGGIIDVFLPVESRISVTVGDHVLAGSTVIAHLIHAQAVTAIQN